MRKGRYIQAAVTSGRCRIEVTSDNMSDPAEGLMSGSREQTVVEIEADARGTGAGACALSEEQWRKLVAEVDRAIEQEKRGGC